MRTSLPLVLSLLVCTAGFLPAYGGVRVVSDIDDTAKITNVSDPWMAVVNGLFSNRAFTGMSPLYLTLKVDRGYDFHYVTAMPSILRSKARGFLTKAAFPDGSLNTKPSGKYASTFEYKVSVIQELMLSHPSDQFIFIGDDTQADVDVYDELYRNYPDQILAIYIRQVKNQSLPPSVYPFLTAFDIARTEHLMNRLTVDQAEPTAQSIINEKRTNRIVPRFAYCPRRLHHFLEERMEQWNQAIADRIEDICKRRGLILE